MILLFSQQIKEKTAYHGQVLNGRKGKLQKIFGAGFPPASLIFLFFATVFRLNLKVAGGDGDGGVAAEHVKSVEPKRCGQQLQRSVRECVCVWGCA